MEVVTSGNGNKEAINTLKEEVLQLRHEQKSDTVDITELKVMMSSTIKSVDKLTKKMDDYIKQDHEAHKQIELSLLDVKKDVKSSAKKWGIVGGLIIAVITGVIMLLIPELFR